MGLIPSTLTTFYNSGSRGSKHPLLTSTGTSHVHGEHTDIQANTCPHKIKKYVRSIQMTRNDLLPQKKKKNLNVMLQKNAFLNLCFTELNDK